MSGKAAQLERACQRTPDQAQPDYQYFLCPGNTVLQHRLGVGAQRGKVRRLIGAGAGIIFKGDGFYETDYKRKRGGSNADRDRKQSESGDSGSESKESSSESKSSESKGSKDSKADRKSD